MVNGRLSVSTHIFFVKIPLPNTYLLYLIFLSSFKELKRIERLKLQHVNKMECGAVVVNSNNTTAPSISPIRIKKRIAPVIVEAVVANADGLRGDA